MSDDETVQALALQLRLLEEYYQDLSNKESILLRLYGEDKASISSITALKDSGRAELLVHLGGGAHLPVAYAGESRLILDVGAGVSIEKTPDEAVAFLTARTKEIEEALRAVTAQKEEVAKRIDLYRRQLTTAVVPKSAGEAAHPSSEEK